jgi:3-methyladenine DNA glycosylase AlkD
MTAGEFIERLEAQQSDEERQKYARYFKASDDFIGVRMGQVFALAKAFIDMPPDEIETLLESPIHEARAGALSIMGKQAARRRTTDERRRELYELYLRRTDRINDWDLVDISAHHVVGGYLTDKPRRVLYELARSPNIWERRIAMYATLAFLRAGEVEDTFGLAEILVDDPEDLVQKVVGGMLREAGKHDRPRLLEFLDRHAATMPRVTLRYSIEHFDKEQKAHYMGLKGAA